MRPLSSAATPPSIMNTQRLIRNFFLLFACGSVLFLVMKEVADHRSAIPSGGTGDRQSLEEVAGPAVVVYYLSQGKDCTVCNNIESYTHETLQTAFAEELRAGRVLWRSLDMDEPRHAHFVTDFSLYTKSVVLAEIREGAVVRYKNLEAVWDHVHDKARFMEFIQQELATFLEQGS